MLKIGIVGYFGYNNLGDEWFVWTWKHLFQGYADIHVVHPLERIDALDAIIIGGGDLVLPTQINNNYFREELYQKPYWIYGIGVTDGPWKDPDATRYYRRVFTGAQGVYVRDPISREILIANKIREDIHVVEDITWASPLAPSYIRDGFGFAESGVKSHGNWLGFSVRPEPLYQREPFCHFLSQVITEFGYRVIAIPLQPSDVPLLSDYNEHQQVVETVNLHVGRQAQLIPPDLILEKRMSVIARCRIYVTLRFHGLIAGLRYRVPTVALVRKPTIKFKTIAGKISSDLTVTDMEMLGQRVKKLAQSPPSYDGLVAQFEARAAQQLASFRDKVLSAIS